MAEVNYTDPETHQRVQGRRTFHLIDLAREWRQGRKKDVARGELRGKRKKRKPVPFSMFADDYFAWWKGRRKESTVARETNRIKGS